MSLQNNKIRHATEIILEQPEIELTEEIQNELSNGKGEE